MSSPASSSPIPTADPATNSKKCDGAGLLRTQFIFISAIGRRHVGSELQDHSVRSPSQICMPSFNHSRLETSWFGRRLRRHHPAGEAEPIVLCRPEIRMKMKTKTTKRTTPPTNRRSCASRTMTRIACSCQSAYSISHELGCEKRSAAQKTLGRRTERRADRAPSRV